jgi:multidrug resistance efflux pump
MPPKRNIVLSVITRTAVCLGLLGMAALIYVVLVATRPKPVVSDLAGPGPRVLVLEARTVPVRRQWSGFGTAVAMDSADVPAEVSAVIGEVPGEIVVGAAVERGQLLVRLDNTDFQRQVEITTQRIADIDAQLEQLDVEQESLTRRVELAEETTRLAERELERVRQALARGAAKELEADRAAQALTISQRTETLAREQLNKVGPRRSQLQAQRMGFEAQLSLAQRNVDRCTVRSPLAGVLSVVDVEAGESLVQGQRVARVVNLARIEVPLQLPASARPTIAVGDEVRLHAAGAVPLAWSGQVARVSPEDDEVTRTVTVYVEVLQDPVNPRLLAPGKFVQGEVVSHLAEARWVVPRRAVQSDRILMIDDGVIVSRPVAVDFEIHYDLPALGLPDDQWVVLRDELRSGDLIVINASRTLPDGLAVQPVVAGRDSATAMSAGKEALR